MSAMNVKKKSITEENKCFNCGSRCNCVTNMTTKKMSGERNSCEGCGYRQVIFSGPDTSEKFCKWLISEQHKNVTAIAHNV